MELKTAGFRLPHPNMGPNLPGGQSALSLHRGTPQSSGGMAEAFGVP